MRAARQECVIRGYRSPLGNSDINLADDDKARLEEVEGDRLQRLAGGFIRGPGRGAPGRRRGMARAGTGDPDVLRGRYGMATR